MLMQDFGVDFASAAFASFAVAPYICIIDRAVIQNASGAMKMTESLKLGLKEFVTQPQKLFKRPEFLMIWGLYYVTYQTANSVDSYGARNKKDVEFTKFASTTAVNLSACISKDRAFTRMFGTKAPTGLPASTYALFASRDALTVAASFTLPARVAPKLQQHGFSEVAALNVAQVVCPVGVQLISTPLHLLGLDLYNRKKESTQSRLQFIKREYAKSCAARMGRILPAFGIGGVVNRSARDMLSCFK